MTHSATLERTLTELDHARLTRLVNRTGGALLASDETVQELLSASDLVEPRAVPPDVVTMYSTLELQDEAGGAPYTLTLCYPEDADPAKGAVSVLSPVGTSLLGLRVGDVARWQLPGGEPRAARIRAVLYQPEASGDYTT